MRASLFGALAAHAILCVGCGDAGGAGGAAGPPDGKTDCAYGEPDCSPCVPYIISQASQILQGEFYDTHGDSVRFEGLAIEGSHNQGIARLADVTTADGRYTRVATSYNHSNGFSVSIRRNEDEAESWATSNETARVDIRQQLNHPGGMQAHGDLVAVALEQEGASGPPAQVQFLEVTGDPTNPAIEFVNNLVLDGSQGEPHQASQSSAATAGFVKLQEGRFLLGVSGADDGKQGIWFYESSGTVIDPNTQWDYVHFWEPHCTGWNKEEDGKKCFAGAAGGLALLTGCEDAEVYLYALHGTFALLKRDYSETQLWRLEHNENDGSIRPEFILERRKSHFFAPTDTSFRWAGGAYVTSAGVLTATALIRQAGRTGEVPNGIATYVPKCRSLMASSTPGVCGILVETVGTARTLNNHAANRGGLASF